MTIITEHNCEKEWESHNGESSRVSLLIRRHTIGVSDQLEWRNHIIGLEVGWRLDVVGFIPLFFPPPRVEFSGLELSKLILDLTLELNWGPQEADVIGLTSLKHVNGNIDRLLPDNVVVSNFKLGGFLNSALTVNGLEVISQLAF